MRFRVAGLWSLVLGLCVAGCSSTGGGGRVPDEGDPLTAGARGKLIKITYLRPSMHKGRYLFEYRIMLSQSWEMKNGPSPREPFTRLVRNPFRSKDLPDELLEQLVDEMVKHGLMDLRTTPIDAINLEELKKLEGTADPNVALPWRIITVETDGIRRTVVRKNNLVPGLSDKFDRVEREVIKVAVLTTVQVSAEQPPFEPPRK